MRRVARRSCPAFLAVLALALGVAPAPAQTDAAPTPRAESLVRASAAPVAIAAGGSARAVVRLAITDGWHVNANPPALDYNIPTTLTLVPSAGVRAGRPAYPAGRAQKFAFDETTMLVYDGAVDVALPLLADAAAVNGAHVLNGRVKYQACNDQVCLQPVSVPFTIEVTVTGGVAPGAAGAPDSSRAPPAGEDTTAAPGDGFTTAPPANGASAATAAALDNPIARALTGGGWAAFAMLFLIGLALNLTPCVYPMLGVTVSIFGARRKAPPLQVFALALVYVLGICVMYSTLGVVAALGGGLFGAFLQNPVVLVAIGALLLVLSLSMFGVY
ncbi:MAG TPA: protein-disulfide reductase DsbD domain-containing protein, partial [Anaeromyxobacter sp.]